MQTCPSNSKKKNMTFSVFGHDLFSNYYTPERDVFQFNFKDGNENTPSRRRGFGTQAYTPEQEHNLHDPIFYNSIILAINVELCKRLILHVLYAGQYGLLLITCRLDPTFCLRFNITQKPKSFCGFFCTARTGRRTDVVHPTILIRCYDVACRPREAYRYGRGNDCGCPARAVLYGCALCCC